MALDYYGKTCAKNVAGNYRKVFIGAVADITGITVTNGEIVSITNGTTFKAFTAEIDTVEFKQEGSGGSNYFITETLTMKFAKKTKELIVALEALKAEVTCGIAAIHVDGNGVAWLTGYDGKATDPQARPLNKLKITFDSGSKPSDAEGNMVTVELSRESEYRNLPFDSTRSDAIIGGSATGYITYS